MKTERNLRGSLASRQSHRLPALNCGAAILISHSNQFNCHQKSHSSSSFDLDSIEVRSDKWLAGYSCFHLSKPWKRFSPKNQTFNLAESDDAETGKHTFCSHWEGF